MYRPGKKMAHVDALSRSVAYIKELPIERQLEFQLSDCKIKEIAKKLELVDDDKFALSDGLVYRKDGGNLKFVVPESLINNIVKAHHDDMAHCGFEKTLRGIQGNYWFPHLRMHKYIENCLTCIMANMRRLTDSRAKQNRRCRRRRQCK